jgi:TPR repeat protein
MYETGEGVKKDLAEAFFWHALSVKGQPRLYSPEDAARVVQQLTPEQIDAVLKRVEAWKPSAPSTAPDALEDGIAAYNRKDGAAALPLLQPLAERGDADAQLHVGRIHKLGMGVPKDEAEALKWFEKAAGQNLADAQTELGMHYQYGIGNDAAKAADWFLKAAIQGQDHAQFKLSSAYADGRGVEKDPMAALFWHLRATHFRPDEGFIKKSAETLSPEQIADVTKGAEAWRPKYAGPVPAEASQPAPTAPSARTGRYAHFPVIWS